MTIFSIHRSFKPMALIAAIAITGLQGAAFAGEAPEPIETRSVDVRATGLDLTDPAGVAALDARIRRAARTVCKPANWRNLDEMAHRAACVRAALEAAQPKGEALVARAEARQMARLQAGGPAS